MQQRFLGSTGLNVSELCLGTMSFGWKTRLPEALALLDRFHEAGGNFIEAAGLCTELVAQPDWATLPEAAIGEWIASRRIDRSDIKLATRLVWSPSLPLPAGNLATCCEASLRRLRTDHLDLLVCDWVGGTDQLEWVLGALTDLVDQGKVRHIAVTGFGAWRQSEAAREAANRTFEPAAVVQDAYSLLDRHTELDLLAHCAPTGLGFLARSALAGGVLAMRYDAERSESNWLRDRRRRYAPARASAVRGEVSRIARELDATMAQVALAWVLANPAVSSAVVSSLSQNQLNDSIEAAALDLSWNQLRRLDLHSSATPEAALAAAGERSVTQPAVEALAVA